MVENSNNSKNPSTGEYLDIKKFIGVASVSVVAINPNNATLKKYGWDIKEDTSEPEYTFSKEALDGTVSEYARIRFLLRIEDIEDKPIVPYDIWIRPEYIIGSNTGKLRIIDSFGRCAWASKEEVKAKKIPQYKSGPANISDDYKGCHPGQEKLVAFLFKFLNITPLQVFSRTTQGWVDSKNPGRLTIDNWKALCSGDVSEIASYLAMQPDNKVKVIFGIKTTEDNKSYQIVLDDCDGTTKSCFIGNSVSPDRQTGEYTTARKRIDEHFENSSNDSTDTFDFAATPVKEYKELATEVKQNTDDNVPEESQGDYFGDNDDDLPFD